MLKCALILLPIFFAANRAHGNPSLPALREGMGMADVLRVAGPAREKLECETRREERWSYAGFLLVFHEGTLRSWASREPAKRHQPTRQPIEGTESAENSQPFSLSELWKELESASGDEPEKQGLSGPPPAATPPPLQQRLPLRNR